MDYLVKVVLFSIWLGFLYWFLDSFLFSKLLVLPFACFLNKFGVIDVFNFFISSLASCFVVKKILQFWQSA